MNRSRIRKDADPDSLTYELQAPARQRLWRTCCQSSDDHRFDCRACEPQQRGAGPFGPVRGPR